MSTPQLLIFEGAFSGGVLPREAEQYLELPRLRDGRIVASGNEPTLNADYFARIILVDEDPIWEWIDQPDHPFHALLHDVCMMRAPIWPSLGAETRAEGRIDADRFVPCQAEVIRRELAGGIGKSIFMMEFLGGANRARKGTTFSHFLGSGNVYPFCYPFLIGPENWVRRALVQFRAYYDSKGYTATVVTEPSQFKSIIKLCTRNLPHLTP